MEYVDIGSTWITTAGVVIVAVIGLVGTVYTIRHAKDKPDEPEPMTDGIIEDLLDRVERLGNDLGDARVEVATLKAELAAAKAKHISDDTLIARLRARVDLLEKRND